MNGLGLVAAIIGALAGGTGLAALAQVFLGRRKLRIEPMIDVQGAALAQMNSLRIDMEQLRRDRDRDHTQIGRLERRVEQLTQVLRDAQMPIPTELPDPIAPGGTA